MPRRTTTFLSGDTRLRTGCTMTVRRLSGRHPVLDLRGHAGWLDCPSPKDARQAARILQPDDRNDTHPRHPVQTASAADGRLCPQPDGAPGSRTAHARSHYIGAPAANGCHRCPSLGASRTCRSGARHHRLEVPWPSLSAFAARIVCRVKGE